MSISDSTPRFGMQRLQAKRALPTRPRSLSSGTKVAYDAQEAEDKMNVRVASGLAQERLRTSRGGRSLSPDTKAVYNAQEAEDTEKIKHKWAARREQAARELNNRGRSPSPSTQDAIRRAMEEFEADDNRGRLLAPPRSSWDYFSSSPTTTEASCPYKHYAARITT
jgi:hypothetical protein